MIITVEVTQQSQDRVFEALIVANRAGQKAQRRALGEVGRKARSVAAKEAAADLGVPQKLVRRRIRAFTKKERKAELASGRLWGGIAGGLRYGQHAQVAQKLRRAHPGGFPVAGKRRGQTSGSGKAWSMFERTGARRYPIVERTVPLSEENIGRALKEGVQDGMKGYPKRLRQLYKLELAGKFKRRRRGRRSRQ